MNLDNFFKQLDYFLLFRLVACILVIRQHVSFSYPDRPFGWLLTGTNFSGESAVVAFVLLSGYLMGKVFQTKRYQLNSEGIKVFFWNRFKRIAPVYYFLLFVYIWFVYPYIISPSQFYLYKDYLIRLLTFTYDGGLPVFNQVVWAISLEAQLYVITPIIVGMLQMLHKKSWILMAFMVSVLFVLGNISIFKDNTFLTYLPVFVAGSTLAYLFSKKFQIRSLLNTIIRLISTLVGVIVLLAPLNDLSSVINHYLIVTLAGLIFIAGIELTGGSQLIKQSTNKFASLLNYLGKLTYVMFLSHMLFVTKVNDTYRQFIGEIVGGETKTGIVALIMSIALTVAFSIFVYHTVEIGGSKLLEKINQNFTKNNTRI
jgi:peptidoglycan/LPS O-acetylase OafA/YrhL